MPPTVRVFKCLQNLLQNIWSAVSSNTDVIIAKEEGVPDAMGSGTTAPHQLLSYSTEHHQSPSYRVLEQKGPSEVSA